MATATIEQLTETTTVQSTDYLVLSRGNVYYKAKVQNLGNGLIKVTGTITQAQAQDGNTTPITVLAAQGAGTYIAPVEGGCGLFLDHNGTTYATANSVRLHHSGQTNYMAQSSTDFVDSAADRREKMVIDVSNPDNFKMFENTALVLSLDANATNNGGPIYYSLLLRIITF